MIPQRINVKVFVSDPSSINPADFVRLFHHWIQEDVVEGLLIDVANYEHIHEGPGVILIGHEADYALDLGGGRPGLRYSRKRAWQDAPAASRGEALQARLRMVLQLALRACQTIEADPLLGGSVTFDPGDLELTFPDRLHLPNAPESVALVRDHVEAALAELYGGRPLELERIHDSPQRAFALRIRVPGAQGISELLAAGLV